MADPESQASSPPIPQAQAQAQPSQPVERFRHVPDWETPAGSRPRHQPFFRRLTAAVSDRVPRLGRRRRQDWDSIVPQFTGVGTGAGVGAAAAGAGPMGSSQQHEHKEIAMEPISLSTSPNTPPLTAGNRNITATGGIMGESAVQADADADPTTTSNTTAANALPPAPPALTPRTLRQRKLGSLLPPNRRYCGRTRRTFLLFIVLPLLLVLLALILGLGLGLRHRSAAASYTQYLPQKAGSKVFSGELTYFNLAVGACGYNNTDEQLVCAVSRHVFDAAGAESGTGANPNTNLLCGMRIRVARGDAELSVTVVDRCTGCAAADIDLSPRAFNTVAAASEGRVKGSWNWLQ